MGTVIRGQVSSRELCRTISKRGLTIDAEHRMHTSHRSTPACLPAFAVDAPKSNMKFDGTVTRLGFCVQVHPRRNADLETGREPNKNHGKYMDTIENDKLKDPETT